MSKHTPGPWVTAERIKTARIDNARMVRPADHCNYKHGATAIVGTSEADANLIAAAPELLQVLQEIVRKDLLAGAIKHDARAAIAKATGEGFSFIGIEREAEYVEIAKARIAAAQAQPKQESLF